MAKKRIGKLPPRYSFMLNPYTDVRLSKCPRCQKLTYLRKFALFIHIDAWGPMALGKTCRYCARCELIMAHQDELEAQLAHSFSQIAPAVLNQSTRDSYTRCPGRTVITRLCVLPVYQCCVA